jgi:hypothetical protein
MINRLSRGGVLMKSLTLRRVAAFAVAAAALFILGCSDDSTQPKETPKPRYPEATAKDIVISNLLLSFKDRNIEQFEKLLHPDYIWYNQPQDVSGGLPKFYARDEDVAITRNMFLAALHTHTNSNLWLDKLELKLYGDEWTLVSEFNSEPCEDCWETTRAYSVTLITTGGAIIYVANDLVKFVVVPVEVDGTKLYKIIRCDDLPRP